jgi:hypothetical protein
MAAVVFTAYLSYQGIIAIIAGRKSKKAKKDARRFLSDFRQTALKRNPDHRRYLRLMADKILKESEVGRFPLHQIGTSLQQLNTTCERYLDDGEFMRSLRARMDIDKPPICFGQRDARAFEPEQAEDDVVLELETTPFRCGPGQQRRWTLDAQNPFQPLKTDPDRDRQQTQPSSPSPESVPTAARPEPQP